MRVFIKKSGWTHDVSGQHREILWEKENMIRAVSDDGVEIISPWQTANKCLIKLHIG